MTKAQQTDKYRAKSDKLKAQSKLRRWLPTIIICLVFDGICIAVKGSFVPEDLSPLLLANAAFLLLNRSRIIRISTGEARRAHAEDMKQARQKLFEEAREKHRKNKETPPQ